ncbi:MAG: RNA polymerase sigma-70 factor ECF subfamily [Bacteroidetes bacterium]|nr:MAG: RNA polymerase sigma-70 factor ECF subfamily [Bacteroidota bacterium]
MHQLDRDSFEQLFRAEYKGLCYFAQKYVKDRDAAREIVQDSFISLWEKRATIDTGRSVKSYLTAVIHNKCHNYLRDNRKFDTNLLQVENLFELGSVDETDILVTRELHQSIGEAIAELPEKCREIFLLNRYENLKYQQIADQLGISVKTVEAQMSKALQHMRIRLAGYIVAFSSLLMVLQALMSAMNK